MPTTLVTARTSRAIATRLADLLMEGEHHLEVVAAGAFEQEPPVWRFEAWFERAPDRGEFTMTVARLLGPEAGGVVFEHRAVDETDWVAKALEDLPPVRAGRFVVHGAHDARKLRANEIGLLVEASMAFGTGHHATTLGCLLTLDRWAANDAVTARKGPRRRGTRVTIADVGTGTGVLALALAKRRKVRAIAGDNDAEAVRIATENARANGVAGLVRVVPAGGRKHPAFRAAGPVPIVVANILAGPLVTLAGDLVAGTARGGRLVLSGLLAWQARMVEAAYLVRGMRLVRRRIIGDWATLEFARR